MVGCYNNRPSDYYGSASLYLKLRNNQSAAILGNDGAHISCLCEDQLLTVSFFSDVETLYDCFQRGLRLSGDQQCLGWRPSPKEPYQWITYKEVNRRAIAFGSGLISLGLSQNNNVRVGTYSKNRPEYIIADQALFHHSLTSVPLYDTLGTDACSYIINQSELSVIICDNNTKISTLLQRRNQFKVLQILISMESLSEENILLAKKNKVTMFHFHDIERLGKENLVRSKPPKQSDLCIICYTSGTTGTPKGVMLTHGNLVATLSGGLKVMAVRLVSAYIDCKKEFSCGLTIDNKDIMISYLPLAHSYERIMEAAMLVNGACIGFFQGDVKTLMDDIKELKPTIFPSVPRLLNRIYDKVLAGINANKFKKFLFKKALNSKTKQLRRGVMDNNSIWDNLVFRKIQALLGGRLRLITTGSAPISETVVRFLRCIIGCPIVEGYGQTENAAVCTFTLIGDIESGHVGPPLPCNMIKLIDVPEMNYLSSSDRGEICLKGPNVFVGYLKDSEKTMEVLDSNGWLHTGDIGEWLPNGTLKIIDRKKHIFKLSQGEYIAPEKIENILMQSSWISQIYVHGNSLQSCLVAIVVPEHDVFLKLTSKYGYTGSFKELLNNHEVKRLILGDMEDVGKRNGLSPLEIVRDIKLQAEPFTVENGMLTPTFKIRRFEVGKVFAKDIDLMYETVKESHL